MADDGGLFNSIWGWFSTTAVKDEEVDPSTRETGEDVEELLAKYPSKKFPFENIAFEGGGMKGLAHAGGLRVGNKRATLNSVGLRVDASKLFSLIFDQQITYLLTHETVYDCQHLLSHDSTSFGVQQKSARILMLYCV